MAKNGTIMKKLSVIVLIGLFACNKPKADVSEILKADKAFSDLCMDKGMSVAFMNYAADDVVKMRPQEHPIMNKQDLKSMFDEHKNDGDLKFQWKAVKELMACLRKCVIWELIMSFLNP